MLLQYHRFIVLFFLVLNIIASKTTPNKSDNLNLSKHVYAWIEAYNANNNNINVNHNNNNNNIDVNNNNDNKYCINLTLEDFIEGSIDGSHDRSKGYVFEELLYEIIIKSTNRIHV